ncbi:MULTISPECIES: ABC transporter ATP-binding protein [Methylosinus]|uniref:ABC transporter ATP-binding protein n=1 Tax=Methylosinus trichosporium (strain ATCC 35070 / NCIMB 11131 / UNIQEM 75 / OB3b) TaxID=595536 RepID=A0A2D2D3E9_METT3|nr:MULTISPECIES: ABC transporter ATP-binding protein [Methylosinus]ATQ69532.1 ABC transporter ATP-binding protein [Methylosinus trichosporium OB3b]OBS50505.1 ABC transporter [Methylosinus sp. 3S-1]
MSALRVRGLGVDLGGAAILRDLDLDARAGALVGLLGPNGAGKSTLLRALCRLIPIRSGEIAWDGRPLARMSARERATRLAFLPQGQTLHWPISVRRLVELGRLPRLGPLGRIGAADEVAVAAAMAAADVAHLAERAATSLSGGERARALLARALAVEAPALLADEPTASLDPHHAVAIMETLRRIAREGRLVLAVTHDLGLAQRFCDRIILIDEGRIVADGAPDAALTPERLRAVYRVDPAVLTGWTPARQDQPRPL